jgi:hypothetical protein
MDAAVLGSVLDAMYRYVGRCVFELCCPDSIYHNEQVLWYRLRES